jgi:predicted O-methyltransferase YrrM
MVDTIEKLRAQHPNAFDPMVEAIRDAGTDNLSFFGNGYRREGPGSYSLQQNPDEFAALTLFLQSAIDIQFSYLEIGSASGGAARWLHEHLDFEEMFSIDDGGHHRYPELSDNFRNLPMEHLRADSHGPEAKAWLEHWHTTFDVIFIDGDHAWPGVWQDVELCKPHWRTGSLVIFHDIVACGGVKAAWENGVKEGWWITLAEYVGAERGLGIGVGFCL